MSCEGNREVNWYLTYETCRWNNCWRMGLWVWLSWLFYHNCLPRKWCSWPMDRNQGKIFWPKVISLFDTQMSLYFHCFSELKNDKNDEMEPRVANIKWTDKIRSKPGKICLFVDERSWFFTNPFPPPEPGV